MSCIVYDKEGNAHQVKAQSVAGMLKSGYTSKPKSKPKTKPKATEEAKPDTETE